MKWLAVALIVLAGCSSSVCVDKLDLGSETLLAYEEALEVRKLPVAVDKTYSHNGEPYALTVYADGRDMYYVRFTPLQFSDERVYGPFEGDPQTAVACEE